MSYADVLNGVVVSRSTSSSKPTKYPQGVWLRELFINPEVLDTFEYLGSHSIVISDSDVQYISPVLDLPFEEAQSRLKQALAEKAYVFETTGLLGVDTSRAGQAMLNGAWSAVQINPDAVLNFKGEAGWAKMNAAQVTGLAVMVADHVQSRFNQEEAIAVLIDAAIDLADLKSISIDLVAGV